MRWGRLFGSAATCCLVASACRAPTQVTLDIQLGENVLCNDVHSVALAVRSTTIDAEAQFTSQSFTARTNGCVDGSIGTLVVVPDSGSDVAVVVVVAVGAKTKVEDCKAGSYDSCIVARRRVSFIDHTSLSVPISLDADCLGRPCGELTTCRRGTCVDAKVLCDGDACHLGADMMSPPMTLDASTDGPIATPTDGGSGGSDASTDAGADTGVDGSTGGVSCRTDHVIDCNVAGVACSAAKQCCRGAGSSVSCETQCGVGTTRACCSQIECASSETCTWPVGQSNPPNVGSCVPSD